MKDGKKLLYEFYEAIRENPHIGATHISLYMALFKKFLEGNNENPVQFTSRELMTLAKINSRATYHKCMGVLVSSAYIDYFPSSYSLIKSVAYLK